MWIPSLLKPDRPASAPDDERGSDDIAPASPFPSEGVHLDPRGLARLAQRFPVLRVSAGHPLFSEGDYGQSMFLLIDGRSEAGVSGRRGEVLLPGSAIGEATLFSRGPCLATVMACTDCEFIEVDEQAFYAIVRQAPEFAGFVMRTLVRRLKRHAG